MCLTNSIDLMAVTGKKKHYVIIYKLLIARVIHFDRFCIT